MNRKIYKNIKRAAWLFAFVLMLTAVSVISFAESPGEAYYFNGYGPEGNYWQYELWKPAAASLIAALFAGLSCLHVKKSYSMENEKNMSEGFALSAVNGAKFSLGNVSPSPTLIRKFVTSVPIPKDKGRGADRRSGGAGGTMGGMTGGFPGGPGGGGGISHHAGGGRPSMRGGMGGGHRGGRGGRF